MHIKNQTEFLILSEKRSVLISHPELQVESGNKIRD